MPNDIERNFFVLIKFAGDVPIRERILESAKPIKEIIERISNGNYQLVFTADSGDSFGYFLRSKEKASLISAHIQGSTNKTGAAPLLNRDSILVLEVGDDFYGYGFSKGWSWLQHR